MDKAIVLLSGGMDSATALWWAAYKGNKEVAAVLNFNYGQRGWEWEFAAAGRLATRLSTTLGVVIPVHLIHVNLESTSAIMVKGADLRPGQVDKYGNPSTFVPGRNLIHLAHALPYCYAHDAFEIVGGWVEQDVDYPDCRRDFLDAMEVASELALGIGKEVQIHSPLIYKHKSEVVQLGTKLGVPWEITRSCYGETPYHCGECDSCILRAKAFMANGMRDPAYPPEQWDRLCLTLR